MLTLLFVKYVSDKYAADPNALIDVPPGARFADMAAAKNDTRNRPRTPPFSAPPC